MNARISAAVRELIAATILSVEKIIVDGSAQPDSIYQLVHNFKIAGLALMEVLKKRSG